jgi:hypothetical protein
MKQALNTPCRKTPASFWMLNVVAPIVTIEFQTPVSSYATDTDSKSKKNA